MSKPFALVHKERYRIVTACGRVYDCATFNRDDLQFVIRPPSRRTFPVERVTLVAPRIDVRYSYARSVFVPIDTPSLWRPVPARTSPWVHPIRARALPLPTEITR